MIDLMTHCTISRQSTMDEIVGNKHFKINESDEIIMHMGSEM